MSKKQYDKKFWEKEERNCCWTFIIGLLVAGYIGEQLGVNAVLVCILLIGFVAQIIKDLSRKK